MRRTGFLLAVLLLVPRAGRPQQGVPLGPEFRVNTYSTSVQSYPAIASDGTGNFVVVWHSIQDPGYGVFGQRYAISGTPLGGEFRINSYTTGTQGIADVASDPSGNFVVLWMSDEDPGFGVFGQRYASAGTPLGGPFHVNTYTTSGQGFPAVSADAAGNFVVVWESATSIPNYSIAGQRYASSGAPLGGEFRVNTYTAGDQRMSSVAMDPAGNFVVLWSADHDGSSLGIFGQRFAGSGAPLGPEFRVNTFTPGAQYDPSVAIDGSGNFVVVWTSQAQDGSSTGIFGQRFAATGAPAGTEFRVNTYTTSYQVRPEAARDSSGNFVVVWTSQQGIAYSEIFGQRYASSGAPLGAEFRVNTTTTGNQSYGTVAASTAGNFVVAWAGTQLAGSYDVYAQRFSPIVPVELIQVTIE